MMLVITSVRIASCRGPGFKASVGSALCENSCK